MATTDFKSVNEYLATKPASVQSVLEQVRGILRKALPGSEEVISYQIPAYKQDGRVVVYFAGWKQHYSLYPATEGVVAAFTKELAPYEVNKGTIRFPLAEPIPTRLIERIAKQRAKENLELRMAKDDARGRTRPASTTRSAGVRKTASAKQPGAPKQPASAKQTGSVKQTGSAKRLGSSKKPAPATKRTPRAAASKVARGR